jgi:NADPH2:quinone reductase
MRAVIPSGPGGPEVLRVEALPVPQPGKEQVLISVAWAGINPHDFGQRARGAPPPGQTPVLGLECSGEIVAVGAGVSAARIGEKVCALVPGGGYANYCLADNLLALPQPPALTAKQAGALMENLFTAWFNMMELAGLKPGERVLAHGGTGNIGSTAIQIARLIGATPYATVGSEEKRRLCLSIGAEAVVNYRTEDVVASVMTATGGAGVDVIVDTVGVGYTEKNIEMLAKDGRVVYISGGKGAKPMVSVSALMQKRARVTGSLMRPLERPRKIAVAKALKERVWPVLGTRIKPLIDSEFTLETAADAHRRGESGEAAGKILLRV